MLIEHFDTPTYLIATVVVVFIVQAHLPGLRGALCWRVTAPLSHQLRCPCAHEPHDGTRRAHGHGERRHGCGGDVAAHSTNSVHHRRSSEAPFRFAPQTDKELNVHVARDVQQAAAVRVHTVR